MYTTKNFRTKKALKQAITAGEKVTIYQPGLGDTPTDGKVYLEGPHFPEPHRWYATAIVENGFLIKVS